MPSNTEHPSASTASAQPTIRSFDELLAYAAHLTPKRVAVVSPANKETFDSIAEAQKLLRSSFFLAGNAGTIAEGMRSAGADLGMAEIQDCPDIRTALAAAIGAVRNGDADILMKGSVDTSTMMRGVLDEQHGLRTGRLLSDVFIVEFPLRQEGRFVMITDGGMNPAPDLKNKVELIINAVEVAHALGNPMPRVAVLSATEFVMPNIQSTLDAAALAKMNDRGQIRGCIVDGPFALDNALSADAATEKGIRSEVAGKAEILIAPNIESANSLAKSTTYFAGLRLAHVVIGAKAPILIPSRADKADAKLLSVALGTIIAEHHP